MAFDSTVGGANATSLMPVDRLDELLSERLHVTAVSGWTNGQKQAGLMMVSRLMTTRLCVLGEPTYPDQALLFPRSGLLNRNGVEIDPSTIPVDIEYAVVEWLLRIAPSDTSVESDISIQGITKIKAGPVELAFKDEIENSGRSVPANVLAMIPAEWLCPPAVDWSPVSWEFRVY